MVHQGNVKDSKGIESVLSANSNVRVTSTSNQDSNPNNTSVRIGYTFGTDLSSMLRSQMDAAKQTEHMHTMRK